MIHALLVVGLSLLRTVMVFGLGLVIETFSAASEEPSSKNIWLNCQLTVLYFVGEATLAAFISSRMAYEALKFPHHGLIDLSGLTSPLALMFGILVWIAVQDLFYYWIHRFQHYSSWLWAEHAIHHSDEHLNVTTSFRQHWLESSIQSIAITLPMIVLMRPSPALAFWSPLVTVAYSMLIHANSRIYFGKLNRLAASPMSHRIHHSRLPEHEDKNFAAICAFWDVLFGTYCPATSVAPTGLSSGEKIESVRTASLFPFTEWARLLRK